MEAKDKMSQIVSMEISLEANQLSMAPCDPSISHKNEKPELILLSNALKYAHYML